MPSIIIGEGDTDRVVLEALEIRTSTGALAAVLPAKGRAHHGRDDAMKTALAECRGTLSPKTIVLALDLNGRRPDDLREELRRVPPAAEPWERDQPPYLWLKGNRVRVVPCGLPRHPEIVRFGFSEFSMDDYILALVLDEASFEAFASSAKKLATKNMSHSQILDAVQASVDAARTKGIAFQTAKRYLDIFRGVIGFSAPRATFFENVLKHAVPTVRDEILGDLKKALDTD